MTQLIMGKIARSGSKRAAVLSITCSAALLSIQPLLMPLTARADNAADIGYSTNVNAAQGKIAAGTQVKVRLLDPIMSGTARVGDRFRVVVAGDDTSGLPSGTMFYGQISQVRPGSPNSAGSISLQLALPRGNYAFDQYDSSNNTVNSESYDSDNAPPADRYQNSDNAGSSSDNRPGSAVNYVPAPNTPATTASNQPPLTGNGYYQPGFGSANTVTISNDASGTFSGHTPKSAGHTSGIAAAAGAILGFSRKRKLGDAIEGGAIGGVGGAAYDQSQKRGASDVAFKRGDEITVRLNRPMSVRTIVVPADEG